MNSAVTNCGTKGRLSISESTGTRGMKFSGACFALAIAFLASMAAAQVTGSGTKNDIPVWTGTTALGNSVISQSAGNVGIGTKNPSGKLDVQSVSTSQPALVVNSNYPTGTALVVTNSGTAGSGSVATGIFSETTSTTGFGNAVAGFTSGTTGSAGVIGIATSTTTDAVAGVVGFAVSGSHGTGVSASGQGTGLFASTSSCESGGCPTPGNAGIFVTGTGGNVLLGQTDSGAGGVNVFRVDSTGKGFFDGGTQTGGADFAESVAVAKEFTQHGPGDLLIVDVTGKRQMKVSSDSYSTLVAGIYSTKPGVLATAHEMGGIASNEIPLAIVGIVPCKASAENGPIQPGDLLVTSSTPGPR
jgi:hypothetical protein